MTPQRPQEVMWCSPMLMYRRDFQRKISSVPGSSIRKSSGSSPFEERPGGLRYQCGGGFFALFESVGSASGTHTQMAWVQGTLPALMVGHEPRFERPRNQSARHS